MYQVLQVYTSFYFSLIDNFPFKVFKKQVKHCRGDGASEFRRRRRKVNFLGLQQVSETSLRTHLVAAT